MDKQAKASLVHAFVETEKSLARLKDIMRTQGLLPRQEVDDESDEGENVGSPQHSHGIEVGETNNDEKIDEETERDDVEAVAVSFSHGMEVDEADDDEEIDMVDVEATAAPPTHGMEVDDADNKEKIEEEIVVLIMLRFVF